MIYYSGPASELGDIVNLVDRRRSSNHAVSAQLRRTKSKHVSTIDMPFPLKFSKSGVLDEVPEGSTFMSEDIDLRRHSRLVVIARPTAMREDPRSKHTAASCVIPTATALGTGCASLLL